MTDERRERNSLNERLLLSQVPIDCDPEYLRQWVECRGYKVSSVKIIQDLETGTSPSFAQVQLMDSAKLDEAERTLDGLNLRGKLIRVRRMVWSENEADLNQLDAA